MEISLLKSASSVQFACQIKAEDYGLKISGLEEIVEFSAEE
jgi:hypothetical protein